MSHKSRIFPQVSNYHSETSVLCDFTNQYSILNKRKGKSSFDQFSMNLAIKLPRINKKLQNAKRQTHSTHENKINDKQYQQQVNAKLNELKSFISQLQKFNPLMLPNSTAIQNYGSYPQFAHMNYPFMNGAPFPNQGQNKPTQPKGGPNSKKALRRFRKIGMVVYFSIFIKHYSKAFTKNRFKHVYNTYLKNNQIKVLDNSQKLVRRIQQIQLLDLIIKLPKGIKNFSSFNLQSATIISQNASLQQILPSNAKDQFEKALNFINLYIKSLHKILLSQQFLDQFSQFISLGTINQSFMLDHFYLRQQADFIDFSQQKGYLKISPQLQNLLLIISIFGKQILNRILLPIKKNRYFQQKLQQQQSQLQSVSNLSQDFDQVYNLIQIASNILYVLINNIHLQYLHDVHLKKNRNKKNKQLNVELIKQLKTPGYKRKQKQQYDQEQLILGVQISKQINKLIDSSIYQQYLGYLVSEIQKLVAELWKNVKKRNRIHYQEIKQITLGQQKIILNGIKNNKKQIEKQTQRYTHKSSYSTLSSKTSKISSNKPTQKKKKK